MMPDLDALEQEQIKILKRAGVDEAVAAKLLDPTRAVKFSKLPGVSGEVPAPRKGAQFEVTKDVMYMSGGVNKDGDVFDEVYAIALPSLEFSCVHKAEMVLKMATGQRQATFCAGRVVSVSSASQGALDLVTSLDLAEVTKPAEFGPTMIDNLKQRLEAIDKTVTRVAVGMDTIPEAGDSEEHFAALRHAMACIFDVKTKADAIEFELDTLQDITAYLTAQGEAGPVAAAAKKVAALQEAWSGAKKKTPALKKTIKPLIDTQAARISDEIRAFEGAVEKHLGGFSGEKVFAYDTGCDAAYLRIDEMHLEVSALEARRIEPTACRRARPEPHPSPRTNHRWWSSRSRWWSSLSSRRSSSSPTRSPSRPRWSRRCASTSC